MSIALITGATEGIGRAICFKLGKAGYNIAACARTPSRLRDLQEELRSLALPFDEDSVPTDAELRIAQAQLVGWLEGLFHGIQTALFAQQMAARAQLEEMRRHALPGPAGMPGGQLPPGAQPPGTSTGQYL